MKLKRMLDKVESFLSAEDRQRRSERKEMKKILRKLKKKERDLKAAARDEQDAAARAVIADRLTVVHAQRRKGVAALKAMKRSGKPEPASG